MDKIRQYFYTANANKSQKGLYFLIFAVVASVGMVVAGLMLGGWI